MIEKIEGADLHCLFHELRFELFFADDKKCIWMFVDQLLEQCEVGTWVGLQFDPDEFGVEGFRGGLIGRDALGQRKLDLTADQLLYLGSELFRGS